MTANEIVVQSAMATAMGARVSLTGLGQGMYLIIGRDILSDALLRSARGQVVLRLNGRKMLATLPFEGYLALRNSHHVSHIGPVTVDLERLTRMAGTLNEGRADLR